MFASQHELKFVRGSPFLPLDLPLPVDLSVLDPPTRKKKKKIILAI